MRLIFSILTAIVVIIAALVFVGPMFISTEELRNQLFARVESMTGYRLRVSGPVDISLFPSIDLVAEDVGVAQPADRGDAEFATAKSLRFSLMLRGLLEGKVRVKRITLIDPVVAVPQATAAAAPPAPPPAALPGEGQATPGAGQATPGAGQSTPGAGQVAPVPRDEDGGGLASVAQQLKTVTLDKVVIENGTVILPPSDGAPGKRIEQLNLDASLPAFDKSLSFATSAVIDGKALKAEGAVGNFGSFLEGAPAPVRLKVEAPGTLDAPASLGGTATYRDDTLTFSQFSAKSGDKTLAGSAVYKDGTLTLSQFTGTMGRDTFAGQAVYKDNVVNVKSLRANVRGTVLAGSLTANLADKVPYVTAAFASKTLDVNALTGALKSKRSSGGGGGKSASGSGKSASGGGKSASGGGKSDGGPRKRSKSSGWKNEKIDFSSLRLVNGKFSLTAEQLIYDQVKISPVSAQATLNGGKLNASLSKFNLYGGAGNISIAVDASRSTPAQRVSLSVVSFDAYPLLKDAAGLENIEGRGTLNLDLSGAGATQRAIVSTLSGTSSFEFVDGAIRGLNIAKIIRNLGSGVVEGWQGGTTEKTDFASLGASFKVNRGQATTNDLHLAGPLVNMTGAGTVNLPAQSLKLKIEPQLVATLEGQGRQGDLAGLGVPVMIVGPWAKPKIYPDIKGILENPAEALARYKQFSKDLKNVPGLGTNVEALENVIKDGKIDEDALIQGIGGLLTGSKAPQKPDVAAEPDGASASATDAEVTPTAPLSNVIKDGKVDQDALIQGLGGLLGGSKAASPPEPTQTPSAEPQQAEPKEAEQQQKKKVDAEDIAKDAAKQLLNNFLGGR